MFLESQLWCRSANDLWQGIGMTNNILYRATLFCCIIFFVGCYSLDIFTLNQLLFVNSSYVLNNTSFPFYTKKKVLSFSKKKKSL
jgi:hypothetical protein